MGRGEAGEIVEEEGKKKIVTCGSYLTCRNISSRARLGHRIEPAAAGKPYRLAFHAPSAHVVVNRGKIGHGSSSANKVGIREGTTEQRREEGVNRDLRCSRTDLAGRGLLRGYWIGQ